MRDVQKLRDLLERVEKASGPDRDIDLAVHMATVGDMSVHLHMGECVFNAYTASLDASIALVELMFPGWDWLVSRSDLCGEFSAVVEHWDGDAHVANRQTAPLAILSALLRALVSQAEGEVA